MGLASICEKAMKASRRSRAAPESIEWAAMPHALEEIFRPACRDQRRCRVGEHDLAVRSMVPIEHRAAENFVNDPRVLSCVTAANLLDRGAAQSEICGGDGKATYSAIPQLGNMGNARD